MLGGGSGAFLSKAHLISLMRRGLPFDVRPGDEGSQRGFLI